LEKTVNKKPLDFNLYKDFGIDQSYSAFEVIISQIQLHEADDLETDYQVQRYKIFHSEILQNSNGTYDLKLIIAQSSHVF
tara:strand:- start:519 stop:758 length:240 start_codon:yes stop_codon:yes gene_type:complete